MATDRCSHLLENLSEYLDGEASEAVCAAIERHLASCTDCRIVVDTMRQTVYLYRQLPQPEMPETVRERLYRKLDLEALRQQQPPPQEQPPSAPHEGQR